RKAMPGLRFSQSTDMAIHGLWALARLEAPKRFLLLSEIARPQNVSESYLSKVFQKLTREGLVKAVRGKRGGYALARLPAEISVGDVVRAMEAEEAQPMYRCLAEERCCAAAASCLLLTVFAEAERQMYEVLDRVSLADLMADAMQSNEPMAWLHQDLHAFAPHPPVPHPPHLLPSQ
ncbi:RrF2 family transcriptional regulator, partial [Candidatus Entotheonella palauensis]